MPVTKEQLFKEVEALVKEGLEIFRAALKSPEKTAAKSRSKTGGDNTEGEEPKEAPLQFVVTYQSWYTRALPLVKLVLPDRYVEFVEQYKLDRRKEIDFLTYTISDYLIGLQVTRAGQQVVNGAGAMTTKFQHQIFILRTCADRLASALSDIEGTLRAELFDDELEAAAELLKKGHVRAAGALAGVTLERHLGSVAKRHGIAVGKKDPTIADLNEALKKEGVIDVPIWRSVQRYADIRNLAVHNKQRDPSAEEIEELLAGAQRTVKTLF